AALCDGKPKAQWPDLEAIIDSDPRRISWTHNLKEDARKGKTYEFEANAVTPGLYRPFAKQWLYFHRRFNERVYQMPKLFPTQGHHNVVISAAGVGANKSFSAFVSASLPDYEMVSKGQCFPMYWYEPVADPADGLNLFVLGDDDLVESGYIRRHAITDWALGQFRERYAYASISKEDIFWYVYGILHSPEYKTRFAADLKKMLPRIPFAADFRAFSEAGRGLGEIHLGYETIEPYPLQEVLHSTIEDWRVTKMRYPSKADKTAILYNAHLTLKGIPPEALEYVVNGKPAIEVLMDQYQVTTDKDSGIVNDPNRWAEEHGQPRYIVDLIKRVVRVSVETVKIVKGLPALGEAEN
ncbi:MAG: damage-inducible protein, partial [Cyanobacteria bacterium REEB65]|nr:damage-inducible protein [Cyanobacteria bacterium REEB65]